MTGLSGSVRATGGGLPALKAALRSQLAAIEAAEQAQEEQMQPSTLAEAELLEEKLSEALEEVRRLKKDIQSNE
jgi:hypothetical protein